MMEAVSFIVNYFLSKDLVMMTAFLCWTPEHITEVYRSSGSVGVRVRVVTDFHRVTEMTPRGLFPEAVLLDLTCPGADLILREASDRRAFNHRHSWLLLGNSSYDSSVVDTTLGDYEILPDADVSWLATDTLVDVYRVKLDQPLLHTNLGLGRSSSRQQMLALWAALPSAVSRRKDLRNVTLTGVTIITQPQHFKGWSELRNRQIDTFPKLTYPLMMNAAQDLHFRYNLRQVELYGMARNGSFDGLAGLLQQRRAELGLGAMFIRADRLEVLDYFSETFVLTCVFIFRQPARSAVSNVFLAPFSGGVWAASGGVTALSALLLAALRRLRLRTNAAPPPDLQMLTLPETCTFALGTLCQQGFHVTPAVSSMRVVMFSTLLSSLFVFTAYSAKIVAILQTPSDALRTIDDLTRSPMTIGVQETTYKKTYFLESADASTQELYRRKIAPQGDRAYHSVVDGIARVRTGFFAFEVERPSGYDIITQTFTEREKCSLKEIEAFKLPLVAIPMKKHSGYKELFAARMRWQREVGLMERERRVWLTGRVRCEAAGGGFLSVAIRDVLPALQALALGALLSVMLFAAEVGVHLIDKNTNMCHVMHKHTYSSQSAE